MNTKQLAGLCWSNHIGTFGTRRKAQAAFVLVALVASIASATWFQEATVSDLMGQTGISNGDLAIVAGYYSPGDRGGGWFQYESGSTATPDGGHYIQPNSGSGRWVRLLNGETANVKMWGAKGDNSTDNTIIFQKAVDAMAFDWTEELLFPTGDYVITNTIVFPAQVHLRGEGNGNNTHIVMNADKDVFRTSNANNALTGGAIDFDHFLLFENLAISCGVNSVTNAALVICNPGESATVRNLMIYNGGYGIRCFGGGAPGLKLFHVSVFYVTVANVSIEGYLPNGTFLGGIGTHSLIGLSGDHHATDSNATASFVLVNSASPCLSLYDFKAEGQFGGGLVRYKRSGGDGSIGSILIHGGTYNAAGTPAVDRDIVVLIGDTNTIRTPSVYINNINLYGIRYLIRDDLTGTTVDPEAPGGLWQGAARLPVLYEAQLGDPSRPRLVIGDTALAYLSPTANQIGWYRVMIQNVAHLGGRLAINSFTESSALNVDVSCSGESDVAKINVEQQTKNSASIPPCVTEARAGCYYSASKGGYIAFLDVHVVRAVETTPWNRITLAHPLEGHTTFAGGVCQLIKPTLVTSLMPSTNDVLVSCVTNSLVR